MRKKHLKMKLHERDGNGVENTLHHALGPFLVLSQIFGILPVHGVWPTSNVAFVHFSWISLAILMTLLMVSFTLIDLFLSLRVIIERGLKLYTTGPLSFSAISLTGYALFLIVSRNWPDLIKEIRKFEKVFLEEQYASKESKSFSRRIRHFGTCFLTAALFEHLTYVGSAGYDNYVQIKNCNLTVDFLENYFMRERSQIFSIVDFHLWCIPIIAWTTIAMTFTWNFVDIFLTLICLSMTMRFNQLHWRITQHLTKQMPAEFWAEIRRDFMALTDLLSHMDRKLSPLILLSCAHNMYYICVQIFHSMVPKPNFMNDIYYWVSLIFVLLRFLTMMFTAASVNDAAGRILSTIYEVPTAHWCLELKRFNEIIVADLIALSGNQFFFMTRRLILGMAYTIVVYELVMFDQVKDVSDRSSDYCVTQKVFNAF